LSIENYLGYTNWQAIALKWEDHNWYNSLNQHLDICSSELIELLSRRYEFSKNRQSRQLLWLDDIRNPFENNWRSFSPIMPPFECVWVKSYTEFTDWIIKNGLPEAICFDHDLGIENVNQELQEEKSGYDCAKWLVNYCLDNHFTLPKWNIQSANPVGKANIDGLLRSFTKNIRTQKEVKLESDFKMHENILFNKNNSYNKMNIDKELELKFIHAIQKQNTKRTEDEGKIVAKRNSFVFKNFKLNDQIINRLEQLNAKLLQEERRIFSFYRKLEEENEKLVASNIIDDFNIEIIINCFSEQHYQDLEPEFEGNSIYETKVHFMNHQDMEIYMEDDWKDAGVPESLRFFKHCYSFHHLEDHTDLTWYDMSLIEEVWFEIKVDYQFLAKIVS
jgi:hypothetical protein